MACASALTLVVLCWTGPAVAQPAPVSDEAVELAIRRGVDFLWRRQGVSGGWSDPQHDRLYPGGLTSLAAFTLRTAGAEAKDPRLQQAVNTLIEQEADIRSNYARSFRLMLWSALDPIKYRKQMRADVQLLASRQSREGVWGYGGLPGMGPVVPRGWADNSNSQLAILALWEAAQAGGEVNRVIWERAEEAWLACQNEDGGWGYAPVDNVNHLRPESYGSMTAAGLATLYILYDQLYARSGGGFDGARIKNCGRGKPLVRNIREAMERGWQWMNMRFVPERNPGFGTSGLIAPQRWLTYYLYSVERAGVASGYKTFGANDWYRDLAGYLVETQQPDGGWGTISQTCFALLALVKGRTPVVINKLRYGSGDAWNNTPRDAATLTRWLSRKLETPLTWQIVDLSTPEARITDVPILYLSGHLTPELTELEGEALRDYVLSGGTVVAVACCSKRSFQAGAEKIFGELFPRYRREVLPTDHPLWNIHYRLRPNDDIVGFSDGCRTRVFLITRGVNGAWNQNLHKQYEQMFQLGANLLVYATNRTAPRSVSPRLGGGRIAGIGPAGGTSDGVDSAGQAPSALRTMAVGRLMHDGDYWADPYALQKLSQALTRAYDLRLDETEGVDPSYTPLRRFDLLWLTGHTLVPPDDERLERVKTYLDQGGTLVATACCGRKAFDQTFRGMIEHMYGPGRLVPVPADDPLITGRFSFGGGAAETVVTGPLGSDLSRPRLRRSRGRHFVPQTSGAPARGGSSPADGQDSAPADPLHPPVPLLEGVRLPGKDGDGTGSDAGRWAIIYSPIDIHCGCDGHFCIDCNGYQPSDAGAIAGNIILSVYLQRSAK
ncbi:MAG TPA: DUF4159 domain-containing protein [Phycisphaerae bacterium]|nr:DUF4159 domain-containing protein [Phycisphaerae bacterium]